MPPKPKNASSSTTSQTRIPPAATSPSHQASADVRVPVNVLPSDTAPADFKAELLAALREEMVGVFKAELQMAMTETLTQIKSELQSVKMELTANLAATKSDVTELSRTVNGMEEALSSYTDEVVSLKRTVETLSTKVVALENKCEDLEGRSRRNNVRIIGLSEQQDPVTASSISTLLKDAFNLAKEPVVDRAHRSLNPRPKPGERPRPVIARLHYYADCADILQRARNQQRIQIGDSTISVFPDHTARTAKARAAFNDIRRQLKEIPGIRYGLLFPATLRITTNEGVIKSFTSPGEAAIFLKTLT